MKTGRLKVYSLHWPQVIAATEVREILSQQRADASGSVRFVLHFRGHSMGSLSSRGALPKVLEKMESIELGHFISLSSPHLGIQASWLQPLHAWRNLCWLSKPFSQQLAQLAVQDSRQKPFLRLARWVLSSKLSHGSRKSIISGGRCSRN